MADNSFIRAAAALQRSSSRRRGVRRRAAGCGRPGGAPPTRTRAPRGQHRWNEASQDRRVHLSPVRPQGDRVADEEQGEHDARRLFRGQNQGEERRSDRGKSGYSGLRQSGEGGGRDECDPGEGAQRRQVHESSLRCADEDEGEQRIMCALGHMRGWKRTSRFHPQMVRAGS